jgi:tetratricopeptide (TPR) repeat protein
VGIPGTGIYYSKTAGGGHRVRRRAAPLRSNYSAPQATTNYKGCLYALGILVLVVATIATYGLILIPVAFGVGGWMWYRHQQPSSIAQRIIKQAQSAGPAEAVDLFHSALETDPEGLNTLRACASWFAQHQCFQDAAEAYAGIVHLESDLSAERMYVSCLLGAGRVDEAIPRLEHMRSISPAGSSLEAAVLGELATAFLIKGQITQAMAFIDLAPLKKHNLDSALQLCLYVRGVGRYLAGDHRRAIADLERLYAVNPAFSDLVASKAAMEGGTFVFAGPKPYPDWYPIEHREEELASEPQTDSVDTTPITHEALLPSESNLVPEAKIDSDLPPSAPAIPPSVTPDGAWRWDGTQWIPNSPRSAV